MSKNVIFSNALLKVLGKCGINKPDSDGRYTVVLGVLGDSATSGDRYLDTDKVRKCFAPASRLQNMISRGLGWGEWGHPKPSESANPEAFKSRVRIIDERFISHSINEVWLEPMVWEGRTVTGIMGKITPCGPYGGYLKEILDDPKMNAAFSGRYFSDYTRSMGVTNREIHTVVTWDFVFMPGMPGATKYMSPTLEADASYEEQIIVYHEEDIRRAVRREEVMGEVSMESGGLSARDLMSSAGLSLHEPSKIEEMIFRW